VRTGGRRPRVARPHQHEVLLRREAPVGDGGQEGGVEPAHARQQRASSSASRRSVLVSLSAIRRSRRALATSTSCPHSAATRLSHGECVPISSTTRSGGRSPSQARAAAGVVAKRPRSRTAPAASTRQKWQ
jgi:hypothetical protein